MKNTTTKVPTNLKGLAAKFPKKAWWSSRTVHCVLFLSSFLLTSFLINFELPQGVVGREFMVGEPAPHSFFSPFEISFVDEKATGLLKAEKKSEVALVYLVNEKVAKEASAKVDRLFELAHEAKQNTSEGEKPELSELPLEISESTEKFLLSTDSLDETRKHIEVLLSESFGAGLLDYSQKSELLESGASEVSFIHPEKGESLTSVRSLSTVGEVRETLPRLLPDKVRRNRNFKNVILEIANLVLASNLEFNEAETQARRQKAADQVQLIEETIKKHELIVQRGMRITPSDKVRLDEIEKKLVKRKVLYQFYATGTIVFVTYLLCLIYMMHFEKRVMRSYRSLFLIYTLFPFAIAICKAVQLWSGSSVYLMPVALAASLLALLINVRVALLAAVAIGLFIAPMTQFQTDMILMSIISGITAAFATLKLRKRIQFLWLGSTIGLSSFAILFAYRVFLDEPMMESFQISALGLANGLLITTPLCFLLLPLFEWLYNLTTDITLLELSDLNHPLLKRMIVEAPGTYHHSLVVSTLAESACESIGANGLLARVGCYFHDIGKIARSEYFTENNSDKAAGHHQRMAPSMSRDVIKDHVRDGIALGRKYKLKDPILQFIPEHQGTGVIYYFYRKALDSAAPGVAINPNDYRYEGPKPQSRETAVALLSDSTEAASRSLKNPTPDSIRQLVRKIINEKFVDGQLDECDLTLRDLHKIQESFVRNLMAIFHTRISYPTQIPIPGKQVDLFHEDSVIGLYEESHKSSP